MATWGRINQKRTKEPESNDNLRKCHTLHPLFPKDVWTFKRWLNKFDRKLWRKTEPAGMIEKNREIHWPENKTEHNQIARTGKPNVPLTKKTSKIIQNEISAFALQMAPTPDMFAKQKIIIAAAVTQIFRLLIQNGLLCEDQTLERSEVSLSLLPGTPREPSQTI